MKTGVLVFCMAAFASCSGTYKTIEPTSIPHVVEEACFQMVSNSHNCYKKETIVRKDPLKRQVLAREIIEYNCRGAYTHEVSRAKWELQNNKLEKIK